jgi:ribosomal-protein-alanine N-acetyltransferase
LQVSDIRVEFVHIRPGDLEAVCRIDSVAFPSPWPVEYFRDALADNRVLCIGIVVQEQLVAYALGFIEGACFHLSSMAVAPPHRRQGMGEKLLRYVLSQAFQRGCARSRLEVRGGNVAAQSLYQKIGFVQRNSMANYYEGPREDGLEMELDLA